MRIALDRTVDLTAPAPMGVSIRTVGEEDLPVVHQTVEDSMRLHFGHVERDFESWMERRRSSAGFDLELWWLAFVDSHPAGVLLASDARADIGEGFVHILGVMTEYRGRGIAKAMLRVAFAEFAARGRPMVALGVDTQNADGATRLYESVGMRPIMVVDYFEMELSR
jgi:ribosomal protein S18 acetylase RimI-like enzyme